MYKQKQGLVVRWSTFAVCSLLFLFGAYNLYYTFAWTGWNWAIDPWFQYTLPLIEIDIKVAPRLIISIITGGIFLLIFKYLCFSHQKISDFLIDTESEMRKVSWATTGEVMKSSVAVIIIVMIMGAYLFGVDIFFAWFFGKLFS